MPCLCSWVLGCFDFAEWGWLQLSLFFDFCVIIFVVMICAGKGCLCRLWSWVWVVGCFFYVLSSAAISVTLMVRYEESYMTGVRYGQVLCL